MYIANKKELQEFQDTHRPIYQQILEQSHMRLYKFCKKYDIKNNDIIQIKNDCLIFRSDKDIKYTTTLGGFKQEEIPEHFYIKYRKPRTEIYKMKCTEWKILNDVKIAINNNEGFLLSGLPGTGKTNTTRNIIKMLEKKNKVVYKTATTNSATRLIDDCSTLHKCIGLDNNAELYTYKHLQKFKNVDYMIIDEYSMLTSEMYKILSMIKRKYDVKYIIVGDSNQLPAIEEMKRDYDNTYVLKYLCDCNRRILTENKRSDSIMWDIYHNILDGDDVQNKFNKTNRLNTDLHICLTNKMRHNINNTIMRRKVKKKKKFIKLDKLDKVINKKRLSLYEMIIYKDLPVVCKENNKKLDICNNERFVVTNFNVKKKKIIIKNELEKQIELSFFQFQIYMEIGYAITAYVSQGQTFTQPYTIHEWNHWHSSKNWQLVTVSRTTNKNNIYISSKSSSTNKKNIYIKPTIIYESIEKSYKPTIDIKPTPTQKPNGLFGIFNIDKKIKLHVQEPNKENVFKKLNKFIYNHYHKINKKEYTKKENIKYQRIENNFKTFNRTTNKKDLNNSK